MKIFIRTFVFIAAVIIIICAFIKCSSVEKLLMDDKVSTIVISDIVVDFCAGIALLLGACIFSSDDDEKKDGENKNDDDEEDDEETTETENETALDDEQCIELLQKYKSLLDSGVISQEEFEAKKRQLLDI